MFIGHYLKPSYKIISADIILPLPKKIGFREVVMKDNSMPEIV